MRLCLHCRHPLQSQPLSRNALNLNGQLGSISSGRFRLLFSHGSPASRSASHVYNHRGSEEGQNGPGPDAHHCSYYSFTSLKAAETPRLETFHCNTTGSSIHVSRPSTNVFSMKLGRHSLMRPELFLSSICLMSRPISPGQGL